MDICIYIIVIHFILSRIWQPIPLENDVKSIDHWLINHDGEINIFGIQTSYKWQPLDFKEFKSWWLWFFNMIFAWCKKNIWGKKGNSWYPLLQSLNLNTTILYNIMYFHYHDYHFRFLFDHLYVLMMLFIIVICYVIFLPLDFLWYPFVIQFL